MLDFQHVPVPVPVKVATVAVVVVFVAMVAAYFAVSAVVSDAAVLCSAKEPVK